MDDSELLDRYGRDGDQEAFAELVRRHSEWIYPSARRQLRDAHLAEDVTQAVFLLLARKAAGISACSNLGGWLFGTLRYCVKEAGRQRSRQHERVKEAAQMKQDSAAEANWELISPLLDEAIGRLRKSDREAVLLRFYQRKPLAEVGSLLGVSEDAARMRVDRAVEKLRGLLEKQGVTGTSAGLSAVLVGNVVQEVPARVVEGVMSAVGGSGSVVAGGIARGAMRMMAWGKVKVAAVTFGCIALAGGGLAIAAGKGSQVAAPAPAPVVAVASAKPAPAAPAPARSPQADQKAATDAANAFLAALRDRDSQRLAALVAGDTPDSRLATAHKYIAEIRDREYARFPQRLGGTVGSMFTSNRDGQLTSAGFEVNPPIDAETRRASLVLTPSNGKWLVTAAAMPLANSIQKGPTFTAPKVLKPAPPGTYAKACAILLAIHKTADALDERGNVDRQTAAKAIDELTAELGELANTLKGTDLEWPDEVMQKARPAMAKWREIVLENGVSAVNKIIERPDNPLRDAMVPLERTFRIESEVTAGLDAEEASKNNRRPASYGAPIEVTLAWSGQKQTIPGPAEIPSWFKESATYKLWQLRGNIQTFNTTDDAGNRYEISFMGRGRYADGTLQDEISGLNVYRADGTLVASSGGFNKGKPTSWGTMDVTGTRYLWKVAIYEGGVDCNMMAHLFDEDGNQRIWTASRQNRVWLEELRNPIGEDSQVTNQGRSH